MPDEGRDVGWFKLGPYPGNSGSAVIDGHFGRWADGKGSVFDNLSKLRRGDRLYFADATGHATTFIVRASRTYDPQADATAVFRSTDGLAHLNLITCDGVWDKATQSYSRRLVVFTDKQ